MIFPLTPLLLERWMVNAFDGSVVDLEAETEKALMPDSRRFDPHHERLRAYHQESRSSNSDIQSSILPLDNILLLVLEDTDPFPCDSEPILWTD